MPEPNWFIKQGDTGIAFTRTLEDADGDPVNITGGSVAFRMRPIGGTALQASGSAAITDGSAGDVLYAWQAGDTDTAGLFLAEWEVTFVGGAVETFPNGGHDLVLVTAELG